MVKTGYKQTEIGVIPRDWDVRKLIDVVNYADYRGKTPPKTNSGIILVTARNIRNGYIDYRSSQEYVSEDDYDIIMRRGKPLIGDVLITTEAPLGNVATVDIENIALAQRVIKYRTNTEKLYQPYLKYCLLSDNFQRILQDNSSGSTAQGIKGSVLHQLPIILPLPAEQRAISEVLSDVDALIAKLDKLIAKKRDIKTAAMQQLLTGEKRLPGFNGRWEEVQLGALGTFSKGKGIRKDEVIDHGLPCIRYGEIYTKHNDYIKNFYSSIPENIAIESQRLRQGDLLFAGSGETASEIGKCVAFLEDVEAYAGGDIVIFSPNKQNSMFLGYLMNHSTIVNQKSRMGQGDAVVHIQARNLAQLHFSLPPLVEQDAIATIICDMDAEIAALEARRAKTQAIKQGMMQELLTGRTRLYYD